MILMSCSRNESGWGPVTLLLLFICLNFVLQVFLFYSDFDSLSEGSCDLSLKSILVLIWFCSCSLSMFCICWLIPVLVLMLLLDFFSSAIPSQGVKRITFLICVSLNPTIYFSHYLKISSSSSSLSYYLLFSSAISSCCSYWLEYLGFMYVLFITIEVWCIRVKVYKNN